MCIGGRASGAHSGGNARKRTTVCYVFGRGKGREEGRSLNVGKKERLGAF